MFFCKFATISLFQLGFAKQPCSLPLNLGTDRYLYLPIWEHWAAQTGELSLSNFLLKVWRGGYRIAQLRFSLFEHLSSCPARKEKDTDQRWEQSGGRWATLAARASRCWQLDRETPACDWTTESWPGQWCPGEIHVCELRQTFASLPHRDGNLVSTGHTLDPVLGTSRKYKSSQWSLDNSYIQWS